MTGFRVAAAGWYGLERRRRRPVHLRQGHGRRLPGRGVRRPRRHHGAPRPGRARSTRPARSPGTRWPCAAGLAHAAACTDDASYAQLDAAAATVGALASRRAHRARASPHRLQSRRQHVLDLLHRRTTVVDYDDARRSRTSSASRRSSTRCWRAASTCRRQRLRVVVRLAPPTTTRRWSGSPPPCRRRPRRGRRGSEHRAPRRRAPMSRATRRTSPSCTCCGTARCTTRTGPVRPAARLPPLRAGPADGRRRRRGAWPSATSPMSSPARWSARRRPPRRSPSRFSLAVGHRRAAHRERELLRGQDVRRRRRRAAQPAATGEHLRNPFKPVLGRAVHRASPRGCSRALHAARDAAARPRGGLRQPPAADLDRPPLRGAPPALARPAQAPVRAWPR